MPALRPLRTAIKKAQFLDPLGRDWPRILPLKPKVPMPASCTLRTTIKKAQFLDLLAETGNVSDAAAACNLPRRTAYSCRAVDPIFASAWDEALEIGLDALEDESIRRARVGVEGPVFHGGLRCGSVRKYSDLLLIFLLKHRRPHRYGGAVSGYAQAVPLTIGSDPTTIPIQQQR